LSIKKSPALCGAKKKDLNTDDLIFCITRVRHISSSAQVCF